MTRAVLALATLLYLPEPARCCTVCGLGEREVAFRSPRVRRCIGCEQAALVRLAPQRAAAEQVGRDLGDNPPPELYAAAVLIAAQAGASPQAVLQARHFPELYHRARRRALPWFGGDPQRYAQLKAAGAMLAEALRLPR